MDRIDQIIEENDGCHKNRDIRDAMEQYAKECVIASLEKAAGNSEIIYSINGDQEWTLTESITNEKNITLL